MFTGTAISRIFKMAAEIVQKFDNETRPVFKYEHGSVN